MYERFTDRARRVISLAKEEAQIFGHKHIGSEHLLVGLLRGPQHENDGSGQAAEALTRLEVRIEQVRAEVEQEVGRNDPHSRGLDMTPRLMKIHELALREALQIGHNYIGPEHLLLGLIRTGDGVGCQILVKLGADLYKVRRSVLEVIGGLPHGTLVDHEKLESSSPPPGLRLNTILEEPAGQSFTVSPEVIEMLLSCAATCNRVITLEDINDWLEDYKLAKSVED